MAVVDTLITEYKANTTDYEKGVDQAVMGTNKFHGAVSGLTSGLTIFFSAVGAAAVGLSALAVYSGQKAAEFDALVKSLEAVVGGASDAKKALEELRDVAAMPGLGLEEALRGYTSLRRAGLDDDMAMRTIRSAGNANALASGGRAELEQILRGISQIALKPNLSGEELMQLNEAGIPASKIISEMFGTADGGELKKLGVTSKEALEALVEGMEGFPKASGSAKNSIENLGMAVDMAVVAIGTKVNEMMIPTIDTIGGALGNVTDSGLFDSFIESLIDAVGFSSLELSSRTLEDAFVDVAAGILDFVDVVKIVIDAADALFSGRLGGVIPSIKDLLGLTAVEFVAGKANLEIGTGSRGNALRQEMQSNRAALEKKKDDAEDQRLAREAQREADAEAKRQKAAQEAAESEAKALAEQSASYLREQLALSRRVALAAETLVELNKSFFGSSSYGENVLSPVNLSGSPSGGLVGAMQGMIQMELIKAMERR